MVVMDLRRRIMLNEPHIVTTMPAGVVNFSTDLISPLKSCKVEFSPVQSGSGDPSPDNVRPISGWTGCKITRCGKNLFDPLYIYRDGQYLKSDGTFISNSGWCVSGYYSINGAFTLASIGGRVPSVCWYDADKNYISGQNYDTGDADIKTDITVNEPNARYCRFSIYKNKADWPQTVQLVPSVNSGEYVSYIGSTIPIDWTDSAGTIYGGYVDLVSGELVATMASMDLGTLNWYYVTKNDRNYFYAFRSGRKRNGAIMCSSYLYSGYSADSSMGVRADKTLWDDGTASTAVKIKDSAYTDANTFKTSMSGVQLAYELATPITYQLTPTQLKSLCGVNNIWSDANGDISVKYWTH